MDFNAGNLVRFGETPDVEYKYIDGERYIVEGDTIHVFDVKEVNGLDVLIYITPQGESIILVDDLFNFNPTIVNPDNYFKQGEKFRYLGFYGRPPSYIPKVKSTKNYPISGDIFTLSSYEINTHYDTGANKKFINLYFEELDDSVYNFGLHHLIVERLSDSLESSEYDCTCEMSTLLRTSCQCGGR